MNLLLLRPEEVSDQGTAEVGGRRATHLRTVLGVAAGDRVRIGLLGGAIGHAEVTAVGTDRVALRCTFEGDGPAAGDDTLLLAIPRPKVLRRCLEHATALGFGRIVLVRSWFVDKSHVRSRALQATEIEQHLWAGLEQSRRTRPPRVEVHPLFRPFVEDRLQDSVPAGSRLVAHPAAGRGSAEADVRTAAPITLAIGPERGWTGYELDELQSRGFEAVRAGAHPLRVETAVATLYGQLALLRQLAEARASRSGDR